MLSATVGSLVRVASEVNVPGRIRKPASTTQVKKEA